MNPYDREEYERRLEEKEAYELDRADDLIQEQDEEEESED